MNKVINFEWNNFGVLAEVTMDSSMLYIRNENSKTLQMSLRKYKQMAVFVKEKAEGLKGKVVQVRTSKNTADWSNSKWFSDIRSSF